MPSFISLPELGTQVQKRMSTKAARVIPSYDMLPSLGKWVWKDEPCGLEYISNVPITDKGKKGKKDAKGTNRAVASRQAGKAQEKLRFAHLQLQQVRKDVEHTEVLLSDIKNVAHNMMSEMHVLPELFEGLMRAEQFDNFLLHLLSYFGCFYDKITQENKKSSTYIEPSPSEKAAYANSLERIKVAQKFLGRSYCVLVMGTGLDHYHHMECGTSRVSHTYKDRSIFETLHIFCTFVVWLTFRRREFPVVKKEIGRMLRSNTFNPAIRVKFAEETQKAEDKREPLPVVSAQSLSAADYRRLYQSRPPIRSIIHQRSPAIVSVLPEPKEESAWLFTKSRVLNEAIASIVTETDEDLDERFKDLIIDVKKFKIGILGEPYNQFNPFTLSPVGNEDEEQEGEEGEKPAAATEDGGDKSSERSTTSRHATAVSQTTTVIATDDGE